MTASKDYDIRAVVVKALLDAGVDRRDIRHEITLDTSSSGGRVDIAWLRGQSGVAIEIKSGADNLDLLERQMRRYERAFDASLLVYDARHFNGLREGAQGWYWSGYRGLAYRDGALGFVDQILQPLPAAWRPGDPRPDVEERFRAIDLAKADFIEVLHRAVDESSRVSILDYATLLWRDEALSVANALGYPYGPDAKRATRSGALQWMRENAKLREARPLVIEALRGRPSNRWEDAFWARFDAELAA